MNSETRLITFLGKYFPTLDLIVILTAYVASRSFGWSVAHALTIAMWAGLIMFVIAIMLTLQPKSWDRMTNATVLWTTLSMAMAVSVPATYSPTNPFASVGLGLICATAIVAAAIMLEHWMINGVRWFWYAEYGFLPFCLLAVASAEQEGGHRESVIFLLILCWLLHFFWQGFWRQFEKWCAT